MQKYTYTTSVDLEKFTIVVFLENFSFNKYKPTCQDKSFGNRGAAHRPPDGIHTQAHAYQYQCHRDAQVVASDADNGRRYRPPQSVEHALHGNLHHHEHLRIAVDAQVFPAHPVCRLFGNEDGKHLAAEADEQQRTAGAEHSRHPKRGFPCLPDACLLSRRIVLSHKGAQSRRESLGSVPGDCLDLPSGGESHQPDVSSLGGRRVKDVAMMGIARLNNWRLIGPRVKSTMELTPLEQRIGFFD